MDGNTIFCKTGVGEEAVRQRDSLAQRNLRNLLIMVDGHSTVADLARRFGDESAALAALAELEADGLIAATGGVPDFTAAPPSAGEADPASLPATPAEAAPGMPTLASAAAPESKPRPRNPAPGWLERFKSLFPGKGGGPAAKKRTAKYEEGQTIAAVDLKPIRRAPQLLSWPWLILYSVAGVAVLTGLTFALYPYGRHLQDIERSASSMLQDPVKIGDIGFSFLPRPHIVLHNITVGKDAHLSVATARAVPDFLSLAGDRKVLHELLLDKVVVKDAGLGRLALAGAAPARIGRIVLQGLSLDAGGTRLDEINGEVIMAAAGAPETIRLRNADGTFKLDLKPAGEAFRIVFTGSNWKAPFGPNPTFNWIEGQGELRGSRLELERIDARAYEGLVEGKASLSWDGAAVLAGELELKRMNASGLLTALGSVLTAEGDLTATLRLEAKADGFGKLADALRAEGAFDMKRGTARGFDVGEAVRARAPTRGGETKFEQLNGDYLIGREGFQLDNLRLASGLLKAGGKLGMDREGRLDGAMDIELKGSAATQRVSLAVGGTGRDPVLTPGRIR